jgi:hypothetical protein
MRGVHSQLSREELEDLRREMPTGSDLEIRLFYTLLATIGLLNRLYHAVIATPWEGRELREAMREVGKALGKEPRG